VGRKLSRRRRRISAGHLAATTTAAGERRRGQIADDVAGKTLSCNFFVEGDLARSGKDWAPELRPKMAWETV